MVEGPLVHQHDFVLKIIKKMAKTQYSQNMKKNFVTKKKCKKRKHFCHPLPSQTQNASEIIISHFLSKRKSV